ncbi:MAG: Fic family protein [Oligoflexia bacterium]|nr:Fic family protein [Oligoflexia bacterium]
MSPKDEFEFLNSPIWLDYTQQRYLAPDEIRYRIQQKNALGADWPELAKRVVLNRKTGAIPLFMACIDKKFWFFPSDSLTRKLDEIERLGLNLYKRIEQQASFREALFLDSAVEEAITSAIYEGAHSTRAQAQQLIASGSRPKNRDEWMLLNNFKAMLWIQQHRNEPVSEEVILHLHRMVTQNTLEGDDANFSGKFRNDKAFIGPHEGVHHSQIQAAINEAITLTTRNPRYIHPLVRGILFHYFIAFIHPFFDGNGRTARALFYFKAMRNSLEYIQLLSVSAYLKEHGSQYEKVFEKVVTNDCDITYFIDFCLDSIHSALMAVSKKVDYLLRLNELKEKAAVTPSQIGLLQRMALHKFRTVSIEEHAKQIGKSREIARQELKALFEIGLIEVTKSGKKLVYSMNKSKLEALIGTP